MKASGAMLIIALLAASACATPSPAESLEGSRDATFLIIDDGGYVVASRRVGANLVPGPECLRNEGGFEIVTDSLGDDLRVKIGDVMTALAGESRGRDLSQAEFLRMLSEGRLSCHKAFVAEDGSIAAGRAECRDALVLSLEPGGVHSESPSTWSIAPRERDVSGEEIASRVKAPPCGAFIRAEWDEVQPILRAAASVRFPGTIAPDMHSKYESKICEGNVMQKLGRTTAETPLAKAAVAALARYRAHGGRGFMDRFRLDPDYPERFLEDPQAPRLLAPHLEAMCVRLTSGWESPPGVESALARAKN